MPPKSETAWLKERRKSWARLIRRVYEADPLLCRCGQRMRVVGFITQAPVIRKILDHVGRRFEPLVLPGRAPPLFPGILIGPVSRLRFTIEGPEVGRFDVRRVGVALVVRGGFVVHAGLGASILASKSRGKGFRGAKCPRSRRRAVKVDPVGRGPGYWLARTVQVRDEDGRKGAFPPPGREMRKKKIPISKRIPLKAK